MSFGDEIVPWGSSRDPARATSSLSSQFPGELALRDARNGTVRQAQLCAARFVVLQLAERYAMGRVDPTDWSLELAAAAAYIEPLNQKSPVEAQRLRRVLDRLNRDEARGAPAALLTAGDTAAACGHPHGAWGMYSAAFELAVPLRRNAAALSAASRLAELARRLQRPALVRKWERRCCRLLASCH